jgi:hypothetical protein
MNPTRFTHRPVDDPPVIVRTPDQSRIATNLSSPERLFSMEPPLSQPIRFNHTREKTTTLNALRNKHRHDL